MEHKKRKKMLSFEEAMDSLENIVQKLESGNIPLEQLIEAYQLGIEYQKICQEHLDRAELVLEKLNDKGQTEPFSLKHD